MCGVVGYIDGGPRDYDMVRTVTAMSSTLRHRGPDDGGVWTDRASGVALGHRRLSVVDLSPAGQQPMTSHSGRYVMVFNGEIYNHQELRQMIDAACATVPWGGHSDTETLLAGFDLWGINKTIEQAVGMFSMGVWDCEADRLSLVRDRCGEKPLYYGIHGGVLMFASELKALKEHPRFIKDVDRDALALYVRHNHIPAPYSIWRNISKLMPGHIMTFDAGSLQRSTEEYWSGKAVVEGSRFQRYDGIPEQAVDELEQVLGAAVGRQMEADVPLGAFLSGGVDSSTVVALMQAQSTRPVRTFSIGLNEPQYNEAEYAKAVAKHLGTDHTELYVGADAALDVVPKLAELYDEPFSDSSQIPTYLVSEMARRDVTVSLTGDGADELFCGYNRYLMTDSAWGKAQRAPLPVRRAAASLITAVPPETLDTLLRPVRKLLFDGPSVGMGDKAHKAAGVLTAGTVDELYTRLVSHCNDPTSVVLGSSEPLTVLTDQARIPVVDNSVETMMALDMLGYMVDDILVKVDRAGMGVSLETRAPYLDHSVVELAWRLPLEYKLRDGQSKWALRQVLYKHVPPELIERPKMGFGVPLDDWLRGPLRDWAADLLDATRLRREGYFAVDQVTELWTQHLSEAKNNGHRLWTILVFQLWLDHNR